MSKRDVIVIGAGHNGLTAAALLAKQGRSVLVLERRDSIGGLAGAVRFHEAYSAPGILHDTSCVRKWVAEKLALSKHGLARVGAEESAVFAPMDEGSGLLLHRDALSAKSELAAVSPDDAGRYVQYCETIDRFRRVLEPLLSESPPRITPSSPGDFVHLLRLGLKARLLGEKVMIDLLRIVPMPVADWMNECFVSPLVKALVAGPAHDGSYLGPWSPGSAAALLFHEAVAGRPVRGGASALVAALEGACRAAGVEIRLSSGVEEIRFSGGAVSGVTLAGGEKIDAAAVASSCDPASTFLRLIRPSDLPVDFGEKIGAWRSRGTAAKIHLALNGTPRFAGRESEEIAHARLAADLGEIERAFNGVKYGEMPEKPYLDVTIPSFADPSLAPEGCHVLSVIAYGVPYHLDGGWNDERREELGDVVVKRLASCMPGIGSMVAGRQVLTPFDLEEEYGVTGGHLFHGEHGLDQLLFMRPDVSCARYAAPLEGLYLCGSSCHPGGGITCAPGALGASAILGS